MKMKLTSSSSTKRLKKNPKNLNKKKFQLPQLLRVRKKSTHRLLRRKSSSFSKCWRRVEVRDRSLTLRKRTMCLKRRRSKEGDQRRRRRMKAWMKMILIIDSN